MYNEITREIFFTHRTQMMSVFQWKSIKMRDKHSTYNDRQQQERKAYVHIVETHKHTIYLMENVT